MHCIIVLIENVTEHYAILGEMKHAYSSCSITQLLKQVGIRLPSLFNNVYPFCPPFLVEFRLAIWYLKDRYGWFFMFGGYTAPNGTNHWRRRHVSKSNIVAWSTELSLLQPCSLLGIIGAVRSLSWISNGMNGLFCAFPFVGTFSSSSGSL